MRVILIPERKGPKIGTKTAQWANPGLEWRDEVTLLFGAKPICQFGPREHLYCDDTAWSLSKGNGKIGRVQTDQKKKAMFERGKLHKRNSSWRKASLPKKR